MFNKRFFGLIAVLALAFVAGAFAQDRAEVVYLRATKPAKKLMGAPQQPTTSQQTTGSFCRPGDTRLLVAAWNNGGGIFEVCHSEGSVQISRLLVSAQSVEQIIPNGSNEFYAYSNTGKLIDYSFGAGVVDSWRTYGGAFMSLDASSYRTLILRFPWDREVKKVYLYSGGNSFNEPQVKTYQNEIKFGCGYISNLPDGREFCVNPDWWAVYQPMSTFAGPDYVHGRTLADVQHPVNIATSPISPILYVTQGTEYNNPDLPTVGNTSTSASPTFGKLLAIHVGFGDVVSTEVLASEQDIQPDMYAQRLAATAQGVYFIRSAEYKGQKEQQLAFYSIKTKQVSVVAIADGDDILAGLTVMPSASNISSQPVQNRQ